MRYSIEVIDKARDEIQRRRNTALNTRAMRISELKTKAPEIVKLTNLLAETNVKLCQAIIGGNNSSDIIEKIKNENLETQNKIKEMLIMFNYPQDYLEFPYTCKKCKDNGSVMGKNCDCYEELLMKYSVDELNTNGNILLERFEDFNLNYYPTDRLPNGLTIREQMQIVYNHCLNYANNFTLNSPSLYFQGNTGLGKTFLSTAIARKVAEKGYRVVIDSLSNLLNRIEEERFGRAQGNTMNILLEADFVILDDFGSEDVNKHFQPYIYEIINGRMNRKLPLIISTNYSNQELNNKYNERIISRLSSYVPVGFFGKDIRQLIRFNKKGAE